MNRTKIKAIVEALRSQYGLNTIPVDVERLASLIGAQVRREDFDETLSGFALQKHGAKFIGVNSKEGDERQRFTIAHEIGHLHLHKQNTVSYDPGVMMLRNSHSSDGTDVKEIEANRFAAELLMPEESLRADLKKVGDFDLIAESPRSKQLISELADKYQVSVQAMSIRLTTLYFN